MGWRSGLDWARGSGSVRVSMSVHGCVVTVAFVVVHLTIHQEQATIFSQALRGDHPFKFKKCVAVVGHAWVQYVGCVAQFGIASSSSSASRSHWISLAGQCCHPTVHPTTTTREDELKFLRKFKWKACGNHQRNIVAARPCFLSVKLVPQTSRLNATCSRPSNDRCDPDSWTQLTLGIKLVLPKFWC